MTEKIIVTVVLRNGGYSEDMEMPCNIRVDVLCRSLLSALKSKEEYGFDNVRQIYMYNGVRRLQSEKTLTENNIYDGSIITLKYEEDKYGSF